MKKRRVFVLVLAICYWLCGCAEGNQEPRRIRELQFTVLTEEKLPEELKEMIEERKKNPFKVTFMKEGWLYVAEGFGTQMGGGYSICVNDFFESENALYIDTTLLGALEEPVQGSGHSFPYIVIKTEAVDKNVVFR